MNYKHISYEEMETTRLGRIVVRIKNTKKVIDIYEDRLLALVSTKTMLRIYVKDMDRPLVLYDV